MTREEFIEQLDYMGVPYKIEGDKIVVNGTNIKLNLLDSIPSGVRFDNRIGVSLVSLKHLPPDVVFFNREDVFFRDIETISPGVEFRNGGYVYLGKFTDGGLFHYWDGNIKGIDSKRLLNLMIKQEMFI